MCKGSFSEKTELRIKGVKYKSYSKTREQCAKLLAVCFAVLHWHHAEERPETVCFKQAKMRPMFTGHTCPKYGI